MPRNNSEKIPHPELPAAIHQYYKVRVLSQGPTGRSEALWQKLCREDQSWIRKHWGHAAVTPEHKALAYYYRRLANSDGA